MSKAAELIKEYFCAGGLFNPELMEHEKVRDMIALAQEELTAAHAEIARLREALEFLQSKCGFASPWWIKIEGALNPDNLKRLEEAADKGEL